MTASPVAVRESLSSSYEDLRRVALCGAGVGRGVGFALLIHSGMARWMEICTDLLARPAVPPPQRRAEEPRHLDPNLRVEVAMVLAQMALSVHIQGTTTC